MKQSVVKKKIVEAKEVIEKAKYIVYDLLNEPMEEKQKEKVLELFRLLK